MVPNIQRKPAPRIADVQCSRMKFEPGDRIVVKLYQRLSLSEQKKLKKTVEKWAGDVEVLLVDLAVFNVEVEKFRGIL